MSFRTTIELDDARLCEVQSILGTKGIKPTIEAAFDEVVRLARREALLNQMMAGDSLDLGEDTFRASRPRLP